MNYSPVFSLQPGTAPTRLFPRTDVPHMPRDHASTSHNITELQEQQQQHRSSDNSPTHKYTFSPHGQPLPMILSLPLSLSPSLPLPSSHSPLSLSLSLPLPLSLSLSLPLSPSPPPLPASGVCSSLLTAIEGACQGELSLRCRVLRVYRRAMHTSATLTS